MPQDPSPYGLSYQQLVNQNPPHEPEDQGFFFDFIDSLQRGAAQGLGGLAETSEQLTGYGEGVRDWANQTADNQLDQMSAQGRAALQKQFVTRDAQGNLQAGEAMGDWRSWALNFGQLIGQQADILVPGGALSKVGRVAVGKYAARKALQKGASKEAADLAAKEAVQAASRKLNIGGYGVAGTAMAQGFGANHAREDVMAMDYPTLSQSATFGELFRSVDSDPTMMHWSDEEKLAASRELLAEATAKATFEDPRLAGVNAISSLMGGYVLEGALSRALGSTLRGAIGRGAMVEGATETLQEGAEQYSVNQNVRQYADPTRDPMYQVPESALTGGMLGAMAGGTMAIPGGVSPRQRQEQSQVPVEPASPVESTSPVDPLPNAASANPVSQPVAQPEVPQPMSAAADPMPLPYGRDEPSPIAQAMGNLRQQNLEGTPLQQHLEQMEQRPEQATVSPAGDAQPLLAKRHEARDKLVQRGRLLPDTVLSRAYQDASALDPGRTNQILDQAELGQINDEQVLEELTYIIQSRNDQDPVQTRFDQGVAQALEKLKADQEQRRFDQERPNFERDFEAARAQQVELETQEQSKESQQALATQRQNAFAEQARYEGEAAQRFEPTDDVMLAYQRAQQRADLDGERPTLKELKAQLKAKRKRLRKKMRQTGLRPDLQALVMTQQKALENTPATQEIENTGMADAFAFAKAQIQRKSQKALTRMDEAKRSEQQQALDSVLAEWDSVEHGFVGEMPESQPTPLTLPESAPTLSDNTVEADNLNSNSELVDGHSQKSTELSTEIVDKPVVESLFQSSRLTDQQVVDLLEPLPQDAIDQSRALINLGYSATDAARLKFRYQDLKKQGISQTQPVAESTPVPTPNASSLTRNPSEPNHASDPAEFEQLKTFINDYLRNHSGKLKGIRSAYIKAGYKMKPLDAQAQQGGYENLSELERHVKAQYNQAPEVNEPRAADTVSRDESLVSRDESLVSRDAQPETSDIADSALTGNATSLNGNAEPEYAEPPITPGIIGRNPQGFELHQDEDGVRSYRTGTLKITEPVEIVPRPGGYESYVDAENRSEDFLTDEERGAQEPLQSDSAPPVAQSLTGNASSLSGNTEPENSVTADQAAPALTGNASSLSGNPESENSVTADQAASALTGNASSLSGNTEPENSVTAEPLVPDKKRKPTKAAEGYYGGRDKVWSSRKNAQAFAKLHGLKDAVPELHSPFYRLKKVPAISPGETATLYETKKGGKEWDSGAPLYWVEGRDPVRIANLIEARTGRKPNTRDRWVQLPGDLSIINELGFAEIVNGTANDALIRNHPEIQFGKHEKFNAKVPKDFSVYLIPEEVNSEWVDIEVGDSIIDRNGKLLGEVTEKNDVQVQVMNPTTQKTKSYEMKDIVTDGEKRQSIIEEALRRNSADSSSYAEPVQPSPQPEPVSAPSKADKGVVKLVDAVKRAFDRNNRIASKELFVMADSAFGKQADGAYIAKQAYDGMEAGVNQHLLDHHPNLEMLRKKDIDAVVTWIRELERKQERMAPQTKRSEEQMKYQQFSTPHTHSAVAAWLANINLEDTVLEPSAGTGNLATHAKMWNPDRLFVNELEQGRLELLETLPFDQTYSVDASKIHAHLHGKVKPTAVVMNPPFSSDINKSNIKDTSVGAKHVESVLKLLQEGGRLTAILGRGMALDKAKFKPWWDKIKQDYNVRAVVSIDGKEYQRFGTTFDNVIVVIDKTGPTTDEVVTGEVSKVEELVPLLKEIRGDRTRYSDSPRYEHTGAESAPNKSGRQGQTGSARSSGGPGEITHQPVDAVGADRESVGSPGLSDPTNQGVSGTGRRVHRDGDAAVRGGRKRQPQPRGAATVRGDEPSGAAINPSAGAGAGGIGESGDIHGVAGNDGSAISRRLWAIKKSRQRQHGKNLESNFEDYRPSYRFAGAQPHPSLISESAAMAAVEPPKLNYTPNLPDEVMTSGRLSEVQLESVAYAGQVHQSWIRDENGNEFRRGYFIGDGTGVGKGAQAAGIIFDNWRQGRKKAVWISENTKLYKDAIRDANWVGLGEQHLFETNKALNQREGVMYTTYGTLKSVSQGRSRVEQVAEWFGSDYDGVIVFDESHNMRNAIDEKGARGVKKATKTALAGLELQRLLPKARVVYMSATGATEVRNYAYLDRLGLWGDGTAFSNKHDFIQSIESGGLQAMEVVAKDLKTMGLYASRSLSYEGVTYGTLQHKLTKNQHQTWDALSKAWRLVLNDMEDVLVDTGGSKHRNAVSAARSAFWGAHQRFFSQVMTGLKVPSLIKDIEKELAADHSVVIQLTETNEAQQERRLKQAEEEQIDVADLDISGRDILMDFISKGFPTTLFEEYTDEDGNLDTRPVTDADGKAVDDPSAVETRDALLEKMASVNVPEPALNQLLQNFGADGVAEITGRKRRVIRHPDGSAEVLPHTEANKAADAKAFADGRKRILVFSDAGGTGRSYHANKAFKNQQKRVHYVLQPGWRSDKAVQAFGRTHRTNQAQPPHYVLVTSELEAERRFTSTIAKRLAQLGALTKGQRDSSGGGDLISADQDLETIFAETAMMRTFDAVDQLNVAGLMMDQVLDEMGLMKLQNKATGHWNGEYPTMKTFLNRLLSMPMESQNRLYAAFEKFHQEALKYAKETGELDAGMNTEKAGRHGIMSIQLVASDVVPLDIDGDTSVVTLEKEMKLSLVDWDTLHQSAKFDKQTVSWARNTRTGRIYAHWAGTSVTDPQTGRIINRQVLVTPRGKQWMRTEEFDLKHKPFVGMNRAKWDEIYKSVKPTRTTQDVVVTGTLLPIWDRFPAGRAVVTRYITDNGQTILGRTIPNKQVDSVRRKLGLDNAQTKLTPEQVVSAVYDDAAVVSLVNGWRFKRSRVAGEQRIELTDWDYSDKSLLESKGLFSETINYKARLFVPLNKAAAVIGDIVGNKPVDQVVYPGSTEQNIPAFSAVRHGVGKPKKIPLSKKAIEATVDKFLGQYKGAADVSVQIHQTPKTLPGYDPVRDKNANLQAQYEFRNDRVHLVATSFNKRSQVREALREEILVHKGLGFFAPSDRQNIYKAIQKAGLENKQVAKLWAKTVHNYEKIAKEAKMTEEQANRLYAEELLGSLAHSNLQINWLMRGWRTLRNAIKRLLVKAGWIQRSIGEPELRQYIDVVAKAFEQGRAAHRRDFSADILGGPDLFSRTEGVHSDINRLMTETGQPLWDRVKGTFADQRRTLMGALTNLQLQDVFGRAFPAQNNPIRRYYKELQGLEATRNAILTKANEEIEQQWDELSKEEDLAVSRLMLDATTWQVHPDRPLEGQAFYQTLQDQREIFEQVKNDEKLAQVEERLAQLETDHEALSQRWAQLSPKAQSLYQDTEKHFTKRWHELQEALIQRINEQYAQEEQKKPIIDMIRVQFAQAIQNGPYFPMKRFGDHVVLAHKDDEYLREHYESSYAALQRRDELNADGWKAEYTKRPERGAMDLENVPKFVGDLLNKLDFEQKQGAEEVNIGTLQDSIYQLFLKMLPDTSWSKHSLHRRRTPGASVDMRRAFADTMFHYAYHRARITHLHRMQESMERMQEQIDFDEVVEDKKPVAQDLLNEVVLRHEDVINPKGHPIAANLNNFGFMWYLGASPAAGLVNLTQTAFVALPQMAARYGWSKAAAELGRAVKEYAQSPLKKTTHEAWVSLERNSNLTHGERKMLQTLHKDGTIDVTQAHSLAEIAGTDTSTLTNASRLRQKATRWIGSIFHNAEVMNREVTALAAYRLHRQKGEYRGNDETAIDYARQAINDGHFNYAATNRARYMRGNWQRVMLQFKQYSQHMIFTLARNAYLSAKGNSEQEKQMARRTISGILGMHFLFAGAVGMPGMSSLFWVLSKALSGDDDEPVNAEAEFRNFLADSFGQPLSHALSKGVVNAATGLDLSSRVSLDELLWRSPREDLEGRQLGMHYLEQAAGPVVGIGLNFAQGLNLMAEGELQRGAEKMTPKFVRDYLKAGRKAVEGERTLKGDVVLDDFSLMEMLGQSIGFSSARLSDLYDARRFIKDVQGRLGKRRRELINDYKDALNRGGDRYAVIDEIMVFNQQNPAMMITATTIRRSIQATARNHEQTINGVYLPKLQAGLRDIGDFAIH